MAVPTLHRKWPCRPLGLSRALYSALPHCSRPLPSTSGHLGSSPHASRCSSTSAARQASVPLLLLPPAALARTRAGRPRAPMSGLTRAKLWPYPLSPFLPLDVELSHKDPRHAQVIPRGLQQRLEARRCMSHGAPCPSYLKATSSPISSPTALSPSPGPPGPRHSSSRAPIHLQGRSRAAVHRQNSRRPDSLLTL